MDKSKSETVDLYNPDAPPKPDDWLQLEEQLRLSLVEEYHNQNELKIGGAKMHSILHVIVENQVADRLYGVDVELARLTSECGDRHEAIHALASILVLYLQRVMSGDQNVDWEDYHKEIQDLTIKDWKESFSKSG